MGQQLKEVFDLIGEAKIDRPADKAFLEDVKNGRELLNQEELAQVLAIFTKVKGHSAAPREMIATFCSIRDARLSQIEVLGKDGLVSTIDFVPPDRMSTPREVVEETAKMLGIPEPQQLSLAFHSPIPTDIARISPFFPMTTQERAKGKRPFLEDLALIVDNSWGGIAFTGPKLSIDGDEDTLVALLQLIEEGHRTSAEWEQFEQSSPTYAFVGSKRLLAQRAFGVEQPGLREYSRLEQSLTLLTSSSFKMWVNRRNARGGKKKQTYLVSSLISAVRYPSERKIEIQVNPYFYEMFSGNRVTLLDAEIRLKLKSYGKALYRFVESHNENHWIGPMDTLLRVLNAPETKTPKKSASDLNRTIKELVDVGVLLPTSCCKLENKDRKTYKVFLALNPANRPKKLNKVEAIGAATSFKRASIKALEDKTS